ncbi:MAG: FmdB family zinc ribbon protein [Chloroflexota bacterium]
MPIYEYRCVECGGKFEKLVRISDADGKAVCPVCGSEQTHRQVSAFGFLGGGSTSASLGGSCTPGAGGG